VPADRGEVIRRWESDRPFYLIVSGRFDVLIDGYTRLATVIAPNPGSS
jgi:hypothetical protein